MCPVDPVTQEDAFPDERFLFATNGEVDCFLCGHKVSILAAYQMKYDFGPTAYAHKACIEGLGPRRCWLLYHTAIFGAVKNHSHGTIVSLEPPRAST